MIRLDPYIPEWAAYDQVPYEDRWIFNKLDLAHRLQGDCWPVGTRLDPGEYCVRPCINLGGMARGGFRKVVLDRSNFIHEPVGYCVTPWTDELRYWWSFVDDECWLGQRTVYIDDNGIEHMAEIEPTMILPEPLRDISHYLLVETLGSTIIDVSPRHMAEEMRTEVIEHHRQFDPKYEPPSYGKFGFQPKMARVWDEQLQAWTLEEIET